MVQPPDPPTSMPAGPPLPDQPMLPQGHGGIRVWLPPDWRWSSTTRRWLGRWTNPYFRVDRQQWPSAHPVTLLTAPAGQRRVRLLYPSGLGPYLMVHVDLMVHPGQWRQLTVGQTQGQGLQLRPPVFDERGVNVNTAREEDRRRVRWGCLIFVLGLIFVCSGPLLLNRG